MPWKTTDRGHRHTTPPDQGLESTRESRSHHDLLEVHQKTGAAEDELRFYAVIVLVNDPKYNLTDTEKRVVILCIS
jgi:hypothetical protein